MVDNHEVGYDWSSVWTQVCSLSLVPVWVDGICTGDRTVKVIWYYQRSESFMVLFPQIA